MKKSIVLNEDYEASDESWPDDERIKQVLGERFVLPFTGTVIGYRDTPGGRAIEFEIDHRWGFEEGFLFCVDLDALVPEPEDQTPPRPPVNVPPGVTLEVGVRRSGTPLTGASS